MPALDGSPILERTAGSDDMYTTRKAVVSGRASSLPWVYKDNKAAEGIGSSGSSAGCALHLDKLVCPWLFSHPRAVAPQAPHDAKHTGGRRATGGVLKNGGRLLVLL